MQCPAKILSHPRLKLPKRSKVSKVSLRTKNDLLKAGPFTTGGDFPVKEPQEILTWGFFLNPNFFPKVMLKDAPSAEHHQQQQQQQQKQQQHAHIFLQKTTTDFKLKSIFPIVLEEYECPEDIFSGYYDTLDVDKTMDHNHLWIPWPLAGWGFTPRNFGFPIQMANTNAHHGSGIANL